MRLRLRMWKLLVAFMTVRDRGTGELKVRMRLVLGGWPVLGLDRHPHPVCGMEWRWHLHLGRCLSLVFCPRPRLYREERCRGRGRG